MAKEQTLFCPGIPGAGKIILASIVIEYLLQRQEDHVLSKDRIGVAYIYCDFRRPEEQTLENLLRSLLRQLVQQQLLIPDAIRALYDRYKDKPLQPSYEEIRTALTSVTTLYSRVFIVIDALDECPKGCRIRFLSEVVRLQDKTGANLFATSRDVPDIRELFTRCLHVSMEIRASDEDLMVYLESNMSELPALDGHCLQLQEQLKSDIKTAIIKAVDGMYVCSPIRRNACLLT